MGSDPTTWPEGRQLRRLTSAEVLRMDELGLIREDEPVELLDGAMIVAEPQDPVHAARLHRIGRMLAEVYEPEHHVRYQVPLDAGVHSLPEPDLCVARGAIEDYSTRHPAGPDAILVVEIAVTSLELDRSKIDVYLRAGVRVYWIVDEKHRRLEVHLAGERTEPGPRALGTEAPPPPALLLSADQEVELPGTGRCVSVAALLA